MTLMKKPTIRYLVDFLDKEPKMSESIKLKNGIEVLFHTFKDRPFSGASSIITEGISNDDGRCELIFSFHPFSEGLNFEIKSLMSTYFDFHYLINNRILENGDFLFVPNFTLLKGFDFQAFYLIHPAYFPENILDDYLWLVPIFKSEFEYIKEYGSGSFQDLIIESDFDLSNLERDPII